MSDRVKTLGNPIGQPEYLRPVAEALDSLLRWIVSPIARSSTPPPTPPQSGGSLKTDLQTDLSKLPSADQVTKQFRKAGSGASAKKQSSQSRGPSAGTSVLTKEQVDALQTLASVASAGVPIEDIVSIAQQKIYDTAYETASTRAKRGDEWQPSTFDDTFETITTPPQTKVQELDERTKHLEKFVNQISGRHDES